MCNFELDKINHSLQKPANGEDVFDIDIFNEKFEDKALVDELNSQKVDIEIQAKCQLMNINTAFIEPKLCRNINWFNPYEKNFVNPHQSCPQRVILILLVNKFSKTILVEPVLSASRCPPARFADASRAKNEQLFADGISIPHGKPKIFENSKSACCRIFRQLTNLEIDKQKLTQIKLHTFPNLCIYMSFTCKNAQQSFSRTQRASNKHVSMKWVRGSQIRSSLLLMKGINLMAGMVGGLARQ